ncbi:MAG: HIT family protein, partial [Lentisphaeria bacterium]|nr:HIT family protein [Lentisphaeria bacterium]
TSLYMIPARYNNSYEAYLADIENWVKEDGNKYEFSPHFNVNDYSAYANWSSKNGKDLLALGVAGSRYGNGIVDPKPTVENFISGTMDAIGSGSNPQNALNYERAQYESIQVWKQLVAANYNCFSLCSESPNYLNGSVNIQSKGYTGSSTIPEETAGRMFKVASRIGVALKRSLEADAFNLHLADGTCAGQVVMHAHLHVVPRFAEDDFHWNWRQKQYESSAFADEVQEKICKAFKLDV